MHLSLSLDVPTTKRVLLVLTAFAGVLAAPFVYAEVQSFSAQETLSASKLNGNFSSLQDELTATKLELAALKAKPVVTVNSKSYSLGATYKGSTVPVKGKLTTASKVGREASKELCEAVTSPSGHMCSGAELVRSREVGLAVPTGWYSTGAIDSSKGAPDCLGWTYAESGYGGPFWQGNNGDTTPCDTTAVVLCCDLSPIPLRTGSRPMHFTIDISRPTTSRLLVLLTVASSLVAASVVYADLQKFQDNETLSAKKLNDNFGDLETRFAAQAAKAPAFSDWQRLATPPSFAKVGGQSLPLSISTNPNNFVHDWRREGDSAHVRTCVTISPSAGGAESIGMKLDGLPGALVADANKLGGPVRLGVATAGSAAGLETCLGADPS